MKNLKFFLPILALLLIGCDEYLDVNKDPNRLAYSDLGANKLLPTAMVSAYRNQATTMNQFGNVMMNSWGGNVASFTGGFTNEFQLNIDNAFYRGIFESTFLSVKNFQGVIDLPNADHKNDYARAAALICKAHYLQYAVDLYGDVPYTDAFKGLNNNSPRYNDDQFIYRQLIGCLDEARALIAAADPNASDISGYDECSLVT